MSILRRVFCAALLCLTSLFVLLCGGLSVCAYNDVKVEIPVFCDAVSGSSDAYTIIVEPADALTPAPESSTISIPDGDSGIFTLNITQPGDCTYRVYQQSGKNVHTDYDTTVYIVSVSVINEDDVLRWAVTARIEGQDAKQEQISFTNVNPDFTDPKVTTTSPVVLDEDTTTTASEVTTTAPAEDTTTAPADTTTWDVTDVTTSAGDTTEVTSAPVTTQPVTTEQSFITEIITGDSFPAHAFRITMLGAALTAFIAHLFKRDKSEEDSNDE